MTLAGKYRILEPIPTSGFQSFRGQNAADGSMVMLHFLDPEDEGNQALLALMARLPNRAKKYFLDSGDSEGSPYLVTQVLDDFQTLRTWLERQSSRTMTERAQPRDTVHEAPPGAVEPPVPAPPAAPVPPPAPPAAPGEFTRFFNEPLAPAVPMPPPSPVGPVIPMAAAPAPAPEHDTIRDFTALFEKSKQAKATAKAATPAAPPANQAGDFTAMFAAAGAAQEELVPPPVPQKSGSISDVLGVSSKGRRPDPFLDAAAGPQPDTAMPGRLGFPGFPEPPAPPPPPPATTPTEVLDATYVLRGESSAKPAPPIPPASTGPGDFTLIVRGAEPPAPPPPPLPGVPPSPPAFPPPPAVPPVASAIPSAPPFQAPHLQSPHFPMSPQAPVQAPPLQAPPMPAPPGAAPVVAKNNVTTIAVVALLAFLLTAGVLLVARALFGR